MKKDSAVSAAVGVMILLSLTVMVAAVLAISGSGFIPATSAVRSADISVTADGSRDNFCLVFEHRGGDGLDPGRLKVTTVLDGRQNSTYLSGLLNKSLNTSLWSAGEVITTQNISHTAFILNVTPEELEKYIANATPLEVRVHDAGSTTILYRKTILLRGVSS